MKFGYPVTRDYPWRYFTPAVLTLSASVLVVLTVINVAAVGYETVSTLRNDFNTTLTYWWSPFLSRNKNTCDAYQFVSGSEFFTNTSIFKYSITLIYGSEGFSYSNAPLSEICDFTRYSVKVDRAQRTVLNNAVLLCRSGENNATTYITLSYLVGMLWEEAEYEKNISARGTYVIDNLGSDLLVGVLASGTTPIDFLEAAAVPCDRGPATGYSLMTAQTAACEVDPTSLTNSTVVIAYANGSLTWIELPFPPTREKLFPAALAESIPNYLKALSAVIRMDIGKWNNNYILASADIFNASITPNNAISAVLRKDQTFIPLAMPYEQAVAGASQLLADPSQFLVTAEDRTPAIIAVNYLCHDYRRKSAFSLIISVIAADASMFAAFWGVFTGVASYFASTRRLQSAQIDYLEKV